MNILCMGETLLRYSTEKGCRFSDLSFRTDIGGSETNIAVNLSQCGFKTTLLTKLPNHSLGDSVISFLRSFNVNTDFIQRNDMRIGSYYLEVGSGNRASQVIYDRQKSAMTSFCLEDVNLKTIFDGVDAFVVSGITLALGENVKLAVIEMMKYCQGNNICVIYDNNYRSKMWSIESAGEVFKEVLPYVTILSAGHLDAENFLQLRSQKENHEDKLADYYEQIKRKYPNIQYITSTKRDIVSSSVNDLRGYLYKDKLLVSKQYHIDDIVDRVGGGDAYLSGIIYGLLNKKDLNYTVNFACCASVLKHTIRGDANLFTDKEIEMFMESGISRINR